MCPLVSGHWAYSSNAGAWALNLNNVRSNSNNNVGLRADSNPQRPQLGQRGVKGDAFRRAAQATAKSVGFRTSGRAAFRLEGRAI